MTHHSPAPAPTVTGTDNRCTLPGCVLPARTGQDTCGDERHDRRPSRLARHRAAEHTYANGLALLARVRAEQASR